MAHHPWGPDVIPSTFEYQRATSLEDAIAKLQATNGTGKLLAGGHSLIPLMKLRLSEPTVLIDISHIPNHAGIRERDGVIEIGAGTVHHDIATSPLLTARCPILSETASEIGDQQVRNLGTLGGSIAHADPSADYPATLLALDGEVCLVGPNGERVVKAQNFFQNVFTVDLAPNEIILGVRFVPSRAGAYAKLRQRASHFAIVGVAAVLQVKEGVIQSARVGLTGAVSHATRLRNVEAALAGLTPSPATIAAATKTAGNRLESVNADLHGSQDYRRAMVGVFARRAVEKALDRTGK